MVLENSYILYALVDARFFVFVFGRMVWRQRNQVRQAPANAIIQRILNVGTGPMRLPIQPMRIGTIAKSTPMKNQDNDTACGWSFSGTPSEASARCRGKPKPMATPKRKPIAAPSA